MISRQPFRWARKGGYEISSKGDWRFSALFAIMPDGRTLEMHYACDVKGYDPGGTRWQLGKGKPPLDLSTDTWQAYLDLWRQWAQANLPLMRELYTKVRHYGDGYTLTDMFASTRNNQAHALSFILNELCGFPNKQ